MSYEFVRVVEVGERFGEFYARILCLRNGEEQGAFLTFASLPTDEEAVAAAQRWVFERNVEENPARSQLTHLEFRTRFTFPERMLIDNAQDNASLTGEQKAAIRTLLKDMEMSQFIDLGHPDVSQGVGILEAYGLLAPGRAAQILAH